MERARKPAAALMMLLAAACGRLPTGETEPFVERPAPSLPPIVATTPTPTPSVGATPAPQPTAATPAPTPLPTPASGSSCRLAAMRECGGPEGPAGVYGCCRAESGQLFAEVVDQAIAQIQRERPSLFSGNRVLDDDAYVQGVARILEQRGYCARQGGPEDEVGIKSSNSFSEQYDILFGNGTVRTGGYTVTCRPARF